MNLKNTSFYLYGIDALTVVRNLIFFSLFPLLGAFLLSFIPHPVWSWIGVSYFILVTISLLIVCLWMVYSSIILKPRILTELVRSLHLTGSEQVLDIGCGTGLFTIMIAKRLTTGKAHGIDLWDSKDQSGNKLEKTLVNLRLERVKDKVEIQTANMCSLPYPSQTFDKVVSSLAIHNAPNKLEREKALSEILRVLKPGGTFILIDLHFGKQYARYFNQTGISSAFCSKPFFFYCPPIRVVTGKKKI